MSIDSPRLHIDLSHLYLTGEPTLDTPLCVLRDIARAHGIPLSPLADLVYLVGNTGVRRVNKPPASRKEWSYLGRFMNPEERNWTRSSLIAAYNFYCSFVRGEASLPPDFAPGLPTAASPRRASSLLLYAVCRREGVTLSSSTTFPQLVRIVRWLVGPSSEDLRDLSALLSSAPRVRKRLLPLLLAAWRTSPEEPVTYESLLRFSPSASCPTNRLEAVALAARNFSADLSGFPDPLEEYWSLPRFLSPPLDLTRTFNPLFPPAYYRDLDALARREGFSPEEIATSGGHECLQLAYLTDTFHRGVLPGSPSSTAISLEEVADLPPASLLTFGRREGELHLLTFSELVDLFRSSLSFANPFCGNAPFSSRSLKKLGLICEEEEEEEEIGRQKASLLAALEEVRALTENATGRLARFARLYSRAERATQVRVEAALTSLLHMAMCMRGWLGEESYPLTLALVDDPLLVERRSAEAIGNLEDACSALGSLGEDLLSLPLFLYQSGEFLPTFLGRSFSLRERLELVKRGGSTDEIDSCIRISSNWFAAAAHRYFTAIGRPPPFNITQLRRIA